MRLLLLTVCIHIGRIAYPQLQIKQDEPSSSPSSSHHMAAVSHQSSARPERASIVLHATRPWRASKERKQESCVRQRT
ncbi:hypothetical protein B0T16DRAFT_418637 [Cercophora newfieldiana]|uniref:Secreted protein n=1 Tax=Cercophora newfieldiana TaxID=92897 RepID=A0AA39XV91_9PEZI|nr:hypothetical protein B0T16DRAFT_418637 [Cercophora newfieldiana]